MTKKMMTLILNTEYNEYVTCANMVTDDETFLSLKDQAMAIKRVAAKLGITFKSQVIFIYPDERI